MRRKKVERKDKPAQERYVCVNPSDCRVSKYPPALGMSDDDVQGFEFDHACELFHGAGAMGANSCSGVAAGTGWWGACVGRYC